MCLSVKYPKRGIEVADKDIKVYKVLLMWGGKAEAPYMEASYRCGEVKKVGYFTDFDDTRFNKALPKYYGAPIDAIYAGLHSYTTKVAAVRHAYHARIVVECFIPKGTKFIRGKYGEIVSLRLKVGKAIHGKSELVKAFNKKSEK